MTPSPSPSLISYQSLAAEFDRKLAGTESLLGVADWYSEQYYSDANRELRLDHGSWNCSPSERAALALSLSLEGEEPEAEIATWQCECTKRRGDVCECYATMQAARVAAGRPRALSNDLEGFEMRVDCFRRYAIAAIRDRSAHGDEAAVKKGRKMFLIPCEQGIQVAERAGNHAYAAMMQRQCERFDRALSVDQAAPSSEESGLLPSHPVDSDAVRHAMPAHELIIGYFVSCAAEGLSFYEAMDAWLSGKNIIPKDRLDEIERILVDTAREEMRSRGVKIIPRELSLWPAMLFLAPLGDDQAQDVLAQALRDWPDHGDTPLAELLFQGRRYVALLYAAFAAHPDYAGGDPAQIILRWHEADTAAAESARLVDWFCTAHPMRARRIERDLKIKLRKQGWHV
jgi:hypothetical protein